MKEKKSETLSWDAFQALGNPENAPTEQVEAVATDLNEWKNATIRIHLEKKQRGGKTASVIRGLEDLSNESLEHISKELKKKCGVGGSAKNGEIVIQGDKREGIKEYFISRGFRDVKLAGG